MSREINFPGKDVVREMKKYMESKAYNKLIERRFFQYEKIKKAVWEARNDKGTVNTGGNGRGQVFVSDPTANAAINAAMPIPCVIIEVGENDIEKVRDPEKWLNVIAATYRRYEEGVAADVLRDRYRGEPQVKTCMDNYISKATYYFILREIENYAMMCACQIGLVRVF